MTKQQHTIISREDVPKDTRRGGIVQILLSPKTVGSCSGFMGAVTLAPGDTVAGHYHPYSEEFIYVVGGQVSATLDGVEHVVGAGQALLIPMNCRHRLRNDGHQETFMVIQLSPLAPRPELGHVDTEFSQKGTKPMAHTDNSIIIKAPLELVWAVTNDVERWDSLFTEYASVQILAREGNTIRFRLTMHPDAEGRVWSWVSERTADTNALVVKARRIETGPFELMHIMWSYEEVPGGTKMRWVQDFRMSPQSGVNDEQMADHINANSRAQMAIIKARLEEMAEAASLKACLWEGAD